MNFPVSTLAKTELIRADQVIVGDLTGILGDEIMSTITVDGITALVLGTPSKPSIGEGPSDRMIRIRRRN